VLWVINRALGADFAPERFDHVARWDPAASWIEMRLRARGAQLVRVADLDLTVRFADGEELRTEISAKFTPEQVERELAAAGFALQRWWTDAAGDFGVSLATRT
jgi:L-histidine Nalpha-methyltransferase